MMARLPCKGRGKGGHLELSGASPKAKDRSLRQCPGLVRPDPDPIHIGSVCCTAYRTR